MNRFPEPLQAARKTWRLLAPFSYLDPKQGRLTVPADFETDFASVPRLPVVFELLGAHGHAAAVLQDWLYRTGMLRCVDADRVFFNALRSSGIADGAPG